MKISEHQKRIIMSLADSNMCVSKAARAYFMSEPGYVYQLNRIKQITGKDPKNFYDLAELVNYVLSERKGNETKTT